MPGPLNGVRVVDLCWVYAGPVMTRMLVDLGAEVIKVESSSRPDGTRLGRRPLDPVGAIPEGVNIDLECQPLNHALNRGKRSVSIDITTKEGREVLLDLVSVSDVVTENFSAGTLDRLGLGFEELVKVNERIVLLSMSGTGQFGRLRDVPAYATSLAALSGVSSLVGDEAQLYGVMTPTYGDSNAAIQAGGSLLVALLSTIQGGVGQKIDFSEWQAGLVGLEEAFFESQLGLGTPGPVGNASKFASPHNNFKCSGEDEWVAISVSSDREWSALCGVMGKPELTGASRFASVTSRLINRTEVENLVEEWTLGRSASAISLALQASSVPSFPVLSLEGQFGDAHFMERMVFTEVEHPLVGAEIVPGPPFRYLVDGESQLQVQTPAPLLGEANHYVLCELLGHSENDLERLEGNGVMR